MSENKDLFIAIAGFSVFVVLIIFFLIYVLFAFQKNRIKNLQEKLELKSRFEVEMLNAEIEVQNQTLQGVGQELHDNIGQLLTLTRIYINDLEDQISNKETNSSFESINEALDKTIKEVRSLSKSLDGDHVHQQGIIKAIKQDLDRLKRTKRFSVSLVSNMNDADISKNQALVIFRIYQEAINNALKHAKPKNISVTLNENDRLKSIIIKDDGKGFDLEKNGDGSGLYNMKKRAMLVGANLHVTSKINEGTEVKITI